jgi:hypothetical protein
LGLSPLSSFHVSVKQNGAQVQDYAWSGILPTYANTDIALSPLSLATEAAQIDIQLLSPNGSDDLNPANDTASILFGAPVAWNSGDVELELQTDGYGHQFYWELRGEDGVVIDSGGNVLVAMLDADGAPIDLATSYPDNFHFEKNIPLTGDGLNCVSIRVLSGYGYGVCCDYGEGYVRFKKGGETIYEFKDFGRRGWGRLFAPWVDTKDVPQPQGLKVFPNPSDGNVTVQFELFSPLAMEASVVNLTGQRVLWQPTHRYEAGQQSVVWDVSRLPVGMYWAVLRHSGGTETVKFVVLR